MAKHWFLGAIFHNGSFVLSARNGSDETTRKSDSDTNFKSIHDKQTPILVRSYRTLGLQLDSRYNFERNFNQKYWLLFAGWEHVTGCPNGERNKQQAPHVSVTTPGRCLSRRSILAQATNLTRTGKYTSNSRTRFFRRVFLYVRIAAV